MMAEPAELLKSNGLRVTERRVQILSLIVNHGAAIPLKKIQQELKDFDRVTLYRTMLSLVESGIIHRINMEGEETFYALCGSTCGNHSHHHESHIHFRCTACEEVTCVYPENPLSISASGYKIEELDIQARGLCTKCNN